jgi:hypothetical protein
MKFVKANSILVICGAVVLLALIAIYWPLSFTKAAVVEKASERLTAAKSLSSASVNISIPFGPTFNSPPTKEMIKAKQDAQAAVKQQAEKITADAAKDNQRGRIVGTAENPIPLLNGQQEPFFLPTIDRNKVTPLRFKDDYNRIFPTWVLALTGHNDIHPMPPTETEITAKYEQMMRSQGGGVAGNPAAGDPAGSEARTNFRLNEVVTRAKQLKMYMDDNALLREAEWADSPAEPSAEQIFNAVVECWLQKDILTAINEVNGKSTNVGDSPIKRLERINIGGDGGMPSGFAGGAHGGLFLEQVIATKDAPPPANNGIDSTRTLTGHVGGASYDTVLVGITLYMDPAAENRFYDALYRQNNGYTVLNVKTTVVDPFEAASNGFLYGKTQVVRKEILVEALFFRSWLVPLMPPSIKAGQSTTGGQGARPGTPAAPAGGGGGGNFGNPVDNQL